MGTMEEMNGCRDKTMGACHTDRGVREVTFKLRPSDGHWRGWVESFLGRGNSNCKWPEVERAWLVSF